MSNIVHLLLYFSIWSLFHLNRALLDSSGSGSSSCFCFLSFFHSCTSASIFQTLRLSQWAEEGTGMLTSSPSFSWPTVSHVTDFVHKGINLSSLNCLASDWVDVWWDDLSVCMQVSLWRCCYTQKWHGTWTLKSWREALCTKEERSTRCRQLRLRH